MWGRQLTRVAGALPASQRLCRFFGVKKVVSPVAEYNDPKNEGKAFKRPPYVIPEVRKAEKAKALELKEKEDNKNKLLMARTFTQGTRVEEDRVFGTDLPVYLPLSKASGKEMYFSDKPIDFQSFIEL